MKTVILGEEELPVHAKIHKDKKLASSRHIIYDLRIYGSSLECTLNITRCGDKIKKNRTVRHLPNQSNDFMKYLFPKTSSPFGTNEDLSSDGIDLFMFTTNKLDLDKVRAVI